MFLQALVGYILIGISTFLAWVLPIIYLLVVHCVIMKYNGDIPPSDISTLLLALHQLLGVIMTLNSAINPIIYSYTQRPFKENFAKVFHNVAQKLQVQVRHKSPSITQMMHVDENNKPSNYNSLNTNNLHVRQPSIANGSSSSNV